MIASQLFVKVMEAVAANLSEWELGEIDGNGGRLLGPGGAQLYIRSDKYEYTTTGRLEISCSFPHAPEYGSFQPRNEHGQYIRTARTCSAAKSPVQIAQYIQKQVLPKYLPLYATAALAKQAWLERKTRHRRQLEEIAKIAGVDAPQRDSDRVYIRGSGNLYGHVDVYQDRIHLDIRGIPWDVGFAIIELLVKGV